MPNNWSLSQCLFGEDLLPRHPDLAVTLMEFEKNAVICSAFFSECPQLATRGFPQLNDRLNVLWLGAAASCLIIVFRE